ncbi:Similar to gag-pol: Gag-Pol polyprotein (Human immunodeficiency virus type 1 group O (isolate ANT70)) [Cotesia congregata]|uniref:Similar to gag-pol: Gag-Pol polyprotein (Human immunodeficiency virus type 1 group O (Isolate ANT70)) n=1 Tax=Cotesia congregata TaxID=51543 RepID=A0A8J2HAW8_COTCN|nr:Similar to gag-pol: Gag-Pol polyprotein (Human immunodeficiency virus type 1 group O (isolate ANT70)) [Cotesia congregata]
MDSPIYRHKKNFANWHNWIFHQKSSYVYTPIELFHSHWIIPHYHRYWVIDLTFASANIATKIEWNTLDDLHDSDHYPILISIQDQQTNSTEAYPKRWKIKKANWSQYQNAILAEISRLEAPNFQTKNSYLDTEYQNHPNTPKPLRARIQSYLAQTNLNLQKTFKRETVEISTNYDLNEREKKITASKTFLSLFQEIKNKHIEYKEYYADGSKMDSETGFAVISENSTIAHKLPDSYSIFSCELYAIMRALQEGTQTNENIVIYSDSKSSIQAIGDLHSTNPLVQQIHQTLHQSKETKVAIVWVPSHQGIEGNEKADEEAKNAARADQLNPNIPATWEDTKKYIKSAVRKHWITSWNTTYNSDNQATLSYETKTPPHHQLTRRDQCTITRLKIGHTKVTHAHLFEKSNRPNCENCNSPLNVKHLLIDCNLYTNQRNKHHLSATLQEILNIPIDNRRLLQFLKDTKLYDKI